MTAKRKPAAKRKAAPKRAAAALNQADAGIDFHGLKLEVPPVKDWDGDLVFVMRDIRAGRAADDDAILGVIETVLGDEQIAAVRARVREKRLKVGETYDALFKLFDDMFVARGTSAGESPASAGS